jgi:hypothetical protein
MEILSSLEEVSRALETALGRGDVEEVVSLLARRATLVEGLYRSDRSLLDLAALNRIRLAGERTVAVLRAQRDRLRQTAATVPKAAAHPRLELLG